MTNENIRQQDINTAAWDACDIFRGVMDPAGYKDYILVMLFLKYISDIWEVQYKKYFKKYNDEKLVHRRLKRERFILPKGTSFYDLYEKRDEVNLGELINIALDDIETQNKAKLEGVFRNIDFNSEANLGRPKDRNLRLKKLLENFHKPQLDMRPSRVSEDIIGNTYIYLIEKFASDAGKKAGEFYTPQKVSKLVAGLCDPKPGARICDPACGSGGLLIEASKAVGSHDFSLWGMEANGSTWALCRMNMFLHRVDSARIDWCDALTAPTLIKDDHLMKFDNVVANPPFSLAQWGAEEAQNDRFERFRRGVPPRSKGDYAFISHMIKAAAERKGRVAVVVPHGVLFRGAVEGRIREHLIRDNLLDAVIGLPGNLFQTTSIPVAILVFDRSREKGGTNEKHKDVLFIDASKDYQAGKNQNALLDEHIKKILNAYKRRENVDRYAHLASFEELAENDFNLNIPRYVDTFEEEAEIDIQAVQKEIKKLEYELTDVRREMKVFMKDVQQ